MLILECNKRFTRIQEACAKRFLTFTKFSPGFWKFIRFSPGFQSSPNSTKFHRKTHQFHRKNGRTSFWVNFGGVKCETLLCFFLRFSPSLEIYEALEIHHGLLQACSRFWKFTRCSPSFHQFFIFFTKL